MIILVINILFIYRRRRTTILDKISDTINHKVTEIEIFLRRVNDMYPSLPKTVQRAIDKFAARIDFEHNHIIAIKSLNNQSIDTYNYEEEAKIENARETIGLFNLKTGLDFKPSDEEMTSMEDKFDQYNEVHEEVSTNFIILNIFNIVPINNRYTN